MLGPSRAAAQVISGIGFPVAGTILSRKNAIRGLMTAASVWAVAAGAGLYMAAVATTTILLAILLALKPVEGRFFSHKRQSRYVLQVRSQSGQVVAIEACAAHLGLKVGRLEVRPGKADGTTTIHLDIRDAPPKALATLVEELQHIFGVRRVSYRGHMAHLHTDTDETATTELESSRA